MALPTVTTTLKGLAAITLASLLTLGASSPAFADDSPIPDDATDLELRHELESCLLELSSPFSMPWILSPNLQWAHHRTKFQNCRREVVLRSGPTLH